MLSFFKNLFGIKDNGDKQLLDSENVVTTTPESGPKELQEVANADDQGDIMIPIVTEPTEPQIPYEALPVYDSTLDLREYRYPSLECLRSENAFLVDKFLKQASGSLPVLWGLNGDTLIIKDLTQTNDLFITGTLQTGKTTLVNQLLLSLLFTKHPSQMKLVLADVKGLELTTYRHIEKHFLAKLPGEESAVITSPKQLQNTLSALCIEIDNRYDLFKDAGVRNITEYNEKFVGRKLDPRRGHQYLPYLILIIDDLSSFVLSYKENYFPHLQMLLTKGYRAGVTSVISTGQYSGDLIESEMIKLVKQRAIFHLNQKEDYRRFFDTVRIDRHLATGEFLFNEDIGIGKAKTLLFDYSEIEKVVDFIADQRGYPQSFLLPEFIDENDLLGKEFDASDKDPLFEDAALLIVQNQVGSPSLLQRRMKLGYNRAGRLMDQLEAAGIVGPNMGSKPREVLIKTEAELKEFLLNF